MKNVSKWRVAAAVAIAGAAYLVVMNNALKKEDQLLLKPNSPPVVAMGQQIYKDNCAACHGANLEGQPDWQTPLANGRMPAPPHDIDGHTWHHAERMLVDIMTSGIQQFAGKEYQTDMPSYGGVLTDEEIIAVLSYIKSTWPAETRAQNDQVSRANPGN